MTTAEKLEQMRRSEAHNEREKRKYQRRSRGEYMREFRKARGLTQAQAGRLCGCSECLISLIEEYDAEVTHPKIAARIAEVFKMRKRMAESLLPINYRPGKCYDPNRYVLNGENQDIAERESGEG